MQTDFSLTNEVRNHLETKYEVKYTGSLIYTVNETHYKLQWRVLSQDQPIAVMQGDFETPEDFFKYVKKEITSKRLHEVERFVTKYSDKQGKT